MWKNIFFIPEYFLTLLIIKYNNMKTFTITVEQIEELSKWKHGKRLMQDWFPEAFKKQLEVGKVYKYPNFRGGKFMFKFNGEFGERITYGFDANGKWCNELGIHKERIINGYKEATKEEWLIALKEEAKRRGYKKGVKCKFGTSKEIRTIETNKFFFDFNSNKLYLRHSSGDNADEIFRNGFWAEIVSEYIPTQEEIDRVINYLKNK